MIFRLSQKLNAKIDAGKLAARPLNEIPFADWSAHLFIADRKQYVLLSQDLYPLLGAKIKCRQFHVIPSTLIT